MWTGSDGIIKAVLVALGMASIAIVLGTAWARHPSPGRGSVLGWVNQLDGPQNGRAEQALRRLSRAALPELFQLVRSGTVSAESASYVLSIMGPEVIPDVIAGCEDGDAEVRGAAVGAVALRGLQTGEAIQALSRILRDPCVSNRFMALRALRRAGPGRALVMPALLQFLEEVACESEDPETNALREQILRLLARMGPAAWPAVPRLEEMLGDCSSPHRQEAALALWRVTSDAERVTPVLNNMLKEGDPETRELARIAFRRMARDVELQEDGPQADGVTDPRVRFAPHAAQEAQIGKSTGHYCGRGVASRAESMSN